MKGAYKLGWLGARWKELRELLEKQDFICPLTGRELVPGENASLDHIIPKSRGGPNKIGNLQWLDNNINFAKRNLLPDEFAQLISDAYARMFTKGERP